MLTFIIVAIPLIYYAYVGVEYYGQSKSMDQFFIFGRGMGGRDFTETFVATTMSLATEVTFFLSFGANAGLATFWAPITFIIGTYIFIRILQAFHDTEHGKVFLKSGETIVEFSFERLNHFKSNNFSQAFAFLFCAISVLSLLSIFVIEMFVVTRVFAVFEPLQSDESEFFVVVVFSLLVMMYVYLGGFSSVIKTDRFQLYIMSGAILTILAVGIWFAATSETASIDRVAFSISPLELIGGTWTTALAFLSAFFAINFYRYISYIGSWQRILAVGDKDEIADGVKRTIFFVVLIMTSLIACGMIFASLGFEQGEYDATVMIGYLNLIQSLPGLLGEALLGVVIAGLVAALISTADSHVVAALQTIVYDFRKRAGLHVSTGEEIIKTARRYLLGVLIGAVFAYFILVYLSEWRFDQLLFLFFNLQAILASPIIYIMFRRAPQAWLAVLVTVLGLVAYGLVATVGSSSQLLQFVSPLVIILSGLTLFWVEALVNRGKIE